MKKILLLLLITFKLIANNYLSIQDFKQYDFDFFIGGSVGMDYIKATKTIDKIDYSIGGYTGIRLKNDYE